MFVGELSVPPPELGLVIAQEAGLMPAFAESKLTAAEMVEVPPISREVTPAVKATAIAANAIVIPPLCVELLCALAVIVTCTSAGGGVAGAV